MDVYLTQAGSTELRDSITGPDLSVGLVALGLKRSRMQLVLPVDGVLLKAHSPSCAVDDAVYRDAHSGQTLRRGLGLFATALLDAHPSSFRAEEKDLQTVEQRTRFIVEVLWHNRLRRNEVDVTDRGVLRSLFGRQSERGHGLDALGYP
ncbi:MAG: hypothetical protein CMH52_08345 [Myxococcales bacterium]|nr:hypothetical protein [Myxococcales bacterium]